VREAIRAVAFDLFGTLVTKGDGWRAYRALFRALPPWKWQMARTAALTEPVATISEFHQRVGVRRGPGAAHFEQLVAEDLAAIELFADSIPTLVAARERGLGVGLLSNLAAPYKRPVFELGLAPHFDALVFSCDVGVAKPDRRIYEQLAGMLDVRPAQVLMIGDTRGDDVTGARRAGLHALQIDRSGRRGDLHDLERLLNHPLLADRSRPGL
jgi:HAD superfamily hydrolase (TIGR01509 family)